MAEPTEMDIVRRAYGGEKPGAWATVLDSRRGRQIKRGPVREFGPLTLTGTAPPSKAARSNARIKFRIEIEDVRERFSNSSRAVQHPLYDRNSA